MARSSLVALLALSISANFVLGAQVFNADPATLEKESSVKALKSADRPKESPKAHEELIKNGTNSSQAILQTDEKKDEKKNETVKEQARKVSTESLVLTSTDQNATIATPIPNTSEGNVTRSIEETTPVNKVNLTEPKVGNFTGEQADLNKPKVITQDKEDEETMTIVTQKNETAGNASTSETPEVAANATNANSTDAAITTAITSNTTTSSITTTVNATTTTPTTITTTTTTPPPPTPTPTTPTPTTTTTTTSITPSTTTAKNITITDIEPKKDQIEGKNVTASLEGSEDIKQAGLTEKNKESSDGSKDRSMPSGIIALVTAITFAVAIVIGYISMVVWKQYLEHRYGRRELLVNELEFDTNDLRHFEL